MHAGERRRQLLDTCARVVDVEGFHAATIDRIASEAGVTRTVVYQHFGGLEGMYDALVARAADRAAKTLAAAGDRDDGAPVGVMKAVLAAADADPATWRLFLVVAPAGPPSLVEALDGGRRELRRRVATVFDDAGATDDAELAARLVQAVADELVRLRLADPAEYTHDRLLAGFDVIAGSLTARSTAR